MFFVSFVGDGCGDGPNLYQSQLFWGEQKGSFDAFPLWVHMQPLMKEIMPPQQGQATNPNHQSLFASSMLSTCFYDPLAQEICIFWVIAFECGLVWGQCTLCGWIWGSQVRTKWPRHRALLFCNTNYQVLFSLFVVMFQSSFFFDGIYVIVWKTGFLVMASASVLVKSSCLVVTCPLVNPQASLCSSGNAALGH